MFGIPGTKWAATTCNLGKVKEEEISQSVSSPLSGNERALLDTTGEIPQREIRLAEGGIAGRCCYPAPLS